MAATPKLPLVSGSVRERYHIYHAEAHILSGEIKHPIERPLGSFGRVVLEHTRRESLITQSVSETNIEGLISFERGHTRVSGTQVKQKKDAFGNDHAGWVTQSTAAIKRINVIDIITSDHIVAQVSTEHPTTDGDVPRVNFIGTRFDNLRVGGFPVRFDLDLSLCGDKPENDASYLQDKAFLERVEKQLETFADQDDLPESLEKQYGAEIVYIDELKKRAKERADGERIDGSPKLRFSLIKHIDPIPLPGVRVFGNHIFIPNFGTVALAGVEVGIKSDHSNSLYMMSDSSQSEPSSSNYFTLDMINIQLGCSATGNISGPSATANGSNGPGGSTI